MAKPDSNTVAPEKKIKDAGKNVQLAILSYSEEWLSSFKQLVETSGLSAQLSVTQGNLANHKNLNCDLVVAFLSQNDNLEKYLSDISSIHLVKKIPVIALISSNRREEISERSGELAAEFIMFTPVNPADFTKTIMTLVVSLKLKGQKKTKRTADKKSKQLGEILIEHGLITPLHLKKALDYQKDTGMLIGDALVVLGYITDEQKTHFLASQLGVDIALPMQYASAELDTVALIPEHIARRKMCLALEKDEETLIVAMTDVLDLQLLDNLRDITNMTIKPILGNKDDIRTSIDRFYTDISSHQDASVLMADLDAEDVEFIDKKDADDINLEEAEAAGAELGIVKLVNMLLKNAVRDRASDIHIEPQEHELNIRYRIDGDLRKIMSPPKNSHSAIITRIKILSNLNIAERRLPQDGRMVVKMGRREIDIRVSILPSVFGEKGVLRILDKEAFTVGVNNLGFSERNTEIFMANIKKPYGMIIVTGPTGSGKSTTLYSAIQSIKNVTKNIITVEDPVEFHISGITQVHVRSNIGLTFAASLRSILRQDPDIILIGEIRDAETADIAIKMALTGHLVFSTIHTNDAASSIARFIDIGIPPLLLGSSLNLIIAQRLIRKICKKCKAEYSPEQELIDQLGIEIKPGMKFYKGEGCVSCNGTGYKGRMGLFEMINVNKDIKKLILRNASTLDIQEQAEKSGMDTLRDSGIKSVLNGDTTIEQVIAATTEI